MNLQRIFAVIDREWARTFRSWRDHSPVWIHPLLVTAVLVGLVRCLALSRTHASATGTFDFNRFIDYLLPFFIIMPMVNTSRLAANGTMTDKLSRSLEPLLATPITPGELMLGKMTAAVAPNILVSWVAYALFAVFARAWGFSNSFLCGPLLGPVCLGIIVFVAPLMAVLVANVGFWIASRQPDASRANDRAMGVAGWFMVLPLGLTVWFQHQQHLIGRGELLGLIFALLLANLAMFFFSAKLFHRETVLFKWR